MSNKVPLDAKVDETLKKAAEDVFALLGITMSTAINLYLNQVVVTQGIPFPITTERSPMFSAKNFDSKNNYFNPTLAKVRRITEKEIPVIRYDDEDEKRYLQQPDGQRDFDFSRVRVGEYRYMTLKPVDGSEKIDISLKRPLQVVFERKTKNGYVSARCEMPGIRWYDTQDFSNIEIYEFTRLLIRNEGELSRFWQEKYRAEQG